MFNHQTTAASISKDEIDFILKDEDDDDDSAIGKPLAESQKKFVKNGDAQSGSGDRKDEEEGM